MKYEYEKISYKRLYKIYDNMKTRCLNKNNTSYNRYGGRGITICQEWLDNFQLFYNWAMENGYREDLEIDRIDNNGPYSPENCRWVTKRENCNNRSCTRMLTAFGETKAFTEWLEDPRCVPGRKAFEYRIITLQWDAEKAMTEPVNKIVHYMTVFGETKMMTEWAKDERCVVSFGTLAARIRNGWNYEDAITIPTKSVSRYKNVSKCQNPL